MFEGKRVVHVWFLRKTENIDTVIESIRAISNTLLNFYNKKESLKKINRKDFATEIRNVALTCLCSVL